IHRPEGTWSWFAFPGVTAATPSLVTLRFPADRRRNTAQARDDLHRQLEDASLSVMSEDEIEAATQAPSRRRVAVNAPARAPEPSPEKAPEPLEREVRAIAASPSSPVDLAGPSGDPATLTSAQRSTLAVIRGAGAQGISQWHRGPGFYLKSLPALFRAGLVESL